MKFPIWVLPVLLLLVHTLRAESVTNEEISIEQAIERTLTGNLSIKVLQAALESHHIFVQREKDRFAWNLTPRIAMDSSRNDDITTAGLSLSRKTAWGTAAEASAEATRSTTDDNTLYRQTMFAEIRQPLLRSAGTLPNLEAMRLADSALKASLRELEMNKTDLVVDVATRFESLLETIHQTEMEKTRLDRLDRFHKLTLVREKQGRASRVDTLRAELKLGMARQRLVALEETRRSLDASLSELMGMKPGINFTPLPSELLAMETPSPEVAESIALSNRLDFAQIQQDISDRERGVRIARRNLLPDLTLIARYSSTGEGETLSAAGANDDIWFAGFRLSSDLPLRDERSRVKESTIEQRVAELRLDSMQAAIRRQVRQAVASFDKAKNSRVLAESNYRLARDRLRIAQKLFENGKTDNFSVSEAEDEWLTAEQSLLSAHGEASLAVFRLKRVLGTLLDYPAELKPGPVQ